MRTKQDNREGLLDLSEGVLYDWEARYLSCNASRFTISQLKMVGDTKKKYASHLNFPINRIEYEELSELKKGQLIYFSAKVGSYESKGWKRGTLLAEKGKQITIKTIKNEKT